VGIAEATVATAAALAPARVASAQHTNTRSVSNEQPTNKDHDFLRCGYRQESIVTNVDMKLFAVPREHFLARASLWSRDARVTFAIIGKRRARIF
jgi:hypothetical protein